MNILSGKEIMIPAVQMFWLRPLPDNSYTLLLMDVIIFRQNDLWFMTRNRVLQLRSFFELNACYFPPMLMMIEYEGFLYPFHKTLFPRFDVQILEKLYVNLPPARARAIAMKHTRADHKQRTFVEQQVLEQIHQCQAEFQHRHAFTQQVEDALGIAMPLNPTPTPTPLPAPPEIAAVLSEAPPEPPPKDQRVYCPNCNTVYLIPLHQAEFICDSCGTPVFCRDQETQLPSSEHGTFKRTPNLHVPKIITAPNRIGTWEPNDFT